MRFDFSALPWEMLGPRPVLITLTYPGEWRLWVEDARELHKHREAFKERWRRRFGTPVGVWVTEFQQRGAPHLHLYLGLPDEVTEQEYIGLRKRTLRRKGLEQQLPSYEARRRMRAPAGPFGLWLRTTWWEVVGSELPAHHGRGVDIATVFFSDQAETTANRARVAEYFWRESGKWAQKVPPDGFGGMKFYGRWGQKQGFNPVVSMTELDERTGLELRRVLRRMMVGKLREAAAKTGRKVPRSFGRSRGRDGLTVFNVNGYVVGPRLVEWATQIAVQKAATEMTPRVLTDRRGMPRAFSEIEIVEDEALDDLVVVPDIPEWVDEPDEAWEEAHEARERAEWAQEAEADERARKAEVREFRRRQMRRASARKGPGPRRDEGGGAGDP
jgi:hypothetical protein